MTGAWPIASPASTLVTVVPARVILYLGDIRMFLFTPRTIPRTIADDTDVKLVDLHLARWAPRLHGDVVVSVGQINRGIQRIAIDQKDALVIGVDAHGHRSWRGSHEVNWGTDGRSRCWRRHRHIGQAGK